MAARAAVSERHDERLPDRAASLSRRCCELLDPSKSAPCCRCRTARPRERDAGAGSFPARAQGSRRPRSRWRTGAGCSPVSQPPSWQRRRGRLPGQSRRRVETVKRRQREQPVGHRAAGRCRPSGRGSCTGNAEVGQFAHDVDDAGIANIRHVSSKVTPSTVTSGRPLTAPRMMLRATRLATKAIPAPVRPRRPRNGLLAGDSRPPRPCARCRRRSTPMQWPPTRPGRKGGTFHLVPAAARSKAPHLHTTQDERRRRKSLLELIHYMKIAPWQS